MSAIFVHWCARLGIPSQPEFIAFTITRIVGIGVRPLILFVAVSHGFSGFSDAFALFVTATAASFVVLGNNAHIELYRSTFNHNKDILETYVLTRQYVRNIVSHILWFAPAGMALMYVWIQNIWICLAGVLVLCCEKTYDELQRYYIFERSYIKATIVFSFRYLVPGIVVLIPLAAGENASLWLFIAAHIMAFVIYGAVLERRKARFYTKIYSRAWTRGGALLAYVGEYFRSLHTNHLWTLVSANLVLLDRFMIQRSNTSFGEYVFFANLFNFAVVVHTLLYFTHRRPDLLEKSRYLPAEMLRLSNLLPPLTYCCGIAAISWALITCGAAYKNFSFALLIGLAIYYYIQSVSLVCLEFVFWRVGRGNLLSPTFASSPQFWGLFLCSRPPPTPFLTS